MSIGDQRRIRPGQRLIGRALRAAVSVRGNGRFQAIAPRILPERRQALRFPKGCLSCCWVGCAFRRAGERAQMDSRMTRPVSAPDDRFRARRHPCVVAEPVLCAVRHQCRIFSRPRSSPIGGSSTPWSPGILTDFVNVWSAGKLVLDGHPALAYDWDIQKQVQVAVLGQSYQGNFAWHYPPPFLFVASFAGAFSHMR